MTDTRVDQAHQFFEDLFGGADRGYANLISFEPTVSEWFDLTDPAAFRKMAESAVKRSETVNLYYGINGRAKPTGNERGGHDDIVVVTCFAWDCDIDAGNPTKPQSMDELAEFCATLPPALRPTYLIRSGMGGHAYSFLKEPLTIESAEERSEIGALAKAVERFIHRKAAERGWTFDTVSDLARVLRPPGTWNRKIKYGEPLPVEIVHESGRRFTLDDFTDVLPEDIYDGEPLNAPEEGESVLPAKVVTAIVDILRAVPRDGRRHYLGNYVAGWLANNQVAESSALEVVEKVSVSGGDSGLKDRLKGVRDTYKNLRNGRRPLGYTGLKQLLTPEQLAALDKTLKPIIVAGQSKQAESDENTKTVLELRLTDIGNGQRLAERTKDKMRYCRKITRWFVYDGKRWDEDHNGRVMREAKNSAIAINDLLSSIDDDKQRALVRKHAERSESERALKAAIGLAESEPDIPVQINDFDQNIFDLNVENGTVDLHTGKLRKHNPKDLITKLAPVVYDRNAKCDRFKAFLNEIFDGDQELIRYVQKSLGHAITGDTSERAVFIAYGGGRNGKSTLSNTIKSILGDYALRTPTETLMARKGDSGVPNDVARLKGARFVTASETEEGRRLAVAKIKDFSGNEEISARYMRGEWFEFRPHFKLWLSTNHKPVIPGHDRAAWDRIKLVPFTVQIPPERQDKHLEDRLIEEAPGILQWLIEGCLAWQREGLGEPEAVREATKEYREEMDQLGRFLADCCYLNPSARVSTGSLYIAYTNWCEANREHAVPNHSFGRRLGDRGFESKQLGKNRTRTWFGIGLLTSGPDDNAEPESSQNERGEQQRTAENGSSDINGSAYRSHDVYREQPFTTVHRSPNADFVDEVLIPNA